MAEFGEKATQLSAPQGAGANPIAPATAGIFDNGVLKGVSNIIDIFEKGLANDAKDRAKAQEQAVVGAYAQKLQALNNAAMSGGMKPSEAALRSRIYHGEYVGSYSQYVDEFEKVRKAFDATGIGSAKDQQEDVRKQRNAEISSAQSVGMPVNLNMPEDVIEGMLTNHRTNVAAQKMFEQEQKRIEADRSNRRFDNEVMDREAKENSLRLINTIANTNLDTASTYAQHLGSQVRAGKMNPAEAEQQWSTYTTRIEAEIQSAAALNPSMATPYRDLFNEVRVNGSKYFDPTSDLKTLDNEYKLIIARQKLMMAQDPSMAQVAAASSMFGNDPQVVLAMGKQFGEALLRLTQTSVDAPGVKPQIVGDSEAEKATIKSVTRSIESFNSGKAREPEKLKTEIDNVVGNLLQQLGDSAGRPGVDAKYMADMASFVASPQFGEYVAKNPPNRDAQLLAKKAFQSVYYSGVVKGIDAKLGYALQMPKDASKPRGSPVVSTGPLFDPSSLIIEDRGGMVSLRQAAPSASVSDRQSVRIAQVDIREAERAVNQLIRLRAHLEGHTDYANVWNENKHTLLPRFFKAPDKTVEPKNASGDYVPLYRTEESAMNAIADTPEERARARPAGPPSQAQIRELKEEIERQKDNPKNRKILEDYLKSLGVE